MSLATLEDVRKRLGRQLTTGETERAPGLLDEASDLAVGYLGCEPTPAPSAVARVVSRMVARVLAQDASPGGGESIGVKQIGMTAGPFSQQRTLVDGSGSGSPWLEKADKLKLRAYRCGGGMNSVALSSDQSGRS